MTESKGEMALEFLELLRSLINIEPQATIATLPIPGSPSAPRYEGDPSDLEFFLEEMDFLFDKHRVPESERPKHATRFMDSATRAMWRGLDAYTEASWDEFKEVVSTLYPSPAFSGGSSMAELHRLCTTFVAAGYPTNVQLFGFHRDFLSLSKGLVRIEYLTKREESNMFLRALDPALREDTKFQLRITNPHRRPYAPIPLADIYEAAIHSIELKCDPIIESEGPAGLLESYYRGLWYGSKAKKGNGVASAV